MDGEEGGNQRRVERGGGFERRHRTREAAGAIGARSRRTIFDARRRLISSLSSDSDSDDGVISAEEGTDIIVITEDGVAPIWIISA